MDKNEQVIANLKRQIYELGLSPEVDGPRHSVTEFLDGSYRIFSMRPGDPLHLKRIFTDKTVDYISRIESAAMAGAVWPWREP